MNRKGVSVILMLFEILVVVLAAGIMISGAKNAAQSENVLKENFANNLAISFNTLLAAPEDGWISLPQSERYIIEVNNSQVIVYRNESDQKDQRIKKQFIAPAGFTLEQKISYQRGLRVIKQGNDIRLGTDFSAGSSAPALYCPPEPLSASRTFTIFHHDNQQAAQLVASALGTIPVAADPREINPTIHADHLLWIEIAEGERSVQIILPHTNFACSSRIATLLQEKLRDNEIPSLIRIATPEEQTTLTQGSVAIKLIITRGTSDTYAQPIRDAYSTYFVRP